MKPSPIPMPYPNHVSQPGLHNLWIAFVRSVRDNAIAEVIVQILRLGGVILLARALHPADFGLFRVLVVASALAMLVNESGIPDALIQRKVLTQAHESTAWFLSIVLACVSAATLYLTAPLAAHLMQMPSLKGGMRLLCIPILLEGTAATSNARLRRALRFGSLALADVVAEAGFLIVALAVLWNGHPRLSLPAALGARLAFHAATIWITNPYGPAVLPRVAAARDLFRFSSSVFGGRLLVTLSSNADFVLVGRLLGSQTLGFYSMAWGLLRFIPDRLAKVAVRVTLPAFCRLQDDDVRLARGYRQVIAHLGKVVIPIVTCASIAAPELINFACGPKWVPTALPMRLLAPGLILMGLRVGIGSIYYTKDHPSFDIYLHGARLLMIIVVVSVTAPLGLSAVSMGMSGVEGAISIAGQWMVCALIGLSVLKLVKEVGPGLLLALMCASATVAGKITGILAGAHGLLMVGLLVLPPALVFLWCEAGEVKNMTGKAFSTGDVTAAEPSD